MVIEKITDAEKIREVLRRAWEESEQQLKLMRDQAESMLSYNNDIIIGLNGSVARREVTSGSDVDLFFLSVDGDISKARKAQEEYRSALKKCGIKMPSHGGVFEEPLAVGDILSNIGGDKDTNEFLTRRMLYLLEGEWIHNPLGFESVRKKLIEHYVTVDLEDRKLARYLLNDVIRYWRTICVDFEEKTAGGSKPRAIRLIKLRFSRMMLYFGGVAAISKTENLSASDKRATLLRMLSIPPIERLKDVYGEPQLHGALGAYATFLNSIDHEEIRESLDQEGFEGLNAPEYSELVEVAREFRDGLQELLVDPSCFRHNIASALLL